MSIICISTMDGRITSTRSTVCRAALLELEKRKDADERRRMDEANPDVALFD
ncbi:hypothetical protein F5B20DRAFT_534252 [Whalleya microplaca]|nr:hypothetical protein F5B20DRAFT_534252 [Whalleya microplaca]